jgi:hypothetical protein
MTRSVGSLLQERAARIAGREHERRLLLELLDDSGPLVAYVHGLAGVGKSTLLHAFAAEARGRGAAVVELDAEVVYATRGAFLTTLYERTAAGSGVSAQAARAAGGDPPRVAAALAAEGETVLLAIDAYDQVRPIDDWLCRTFVPSLPANVRVAIAARVAPARAWRTTYAAALRVIALENLRPDAAA